MDALKLIFLFTLLVPLTSATNIVVDYCVADLTFPVGPAGYPCRNPAILTGDDFVYSGLGAAGNFSTTFNAAAVLAVDTTFPALNGLGLSMARLDLGVGGVIPIHSHRASEVILVVEGTIVAGFIDTNNTAFHKTLNKGDIMMFPPTLLHFQVNIGKSPALAFVTLNSASPGFQTTSIALGATDLPTHLIQKVTLLDAREVRRLKNIFGGSN